MPIGSEQVNSRYRTERRARTIALRHANSKSAVTEKAMVWVARST